MYVHVLVYVHVLQCTPEERVVVPLLESVVILDLL